MKLKLFSIFSIASLSLLGLSGCATIWSGGHSTFRNRENDYARSAVSQPAALKTPNGFTALKTTPLLRLPKGQDQFPAHSTPQKLSPPRLDQSAKTILQS